MTLEHILLREWDGMRMVLISKDGKYNIYIDTQGRVTVSNIPVEVMLRNDWLIESPKRYLADKVLNVLAELNPDIRGIPRAREWNDWDYSVLKTTLRGIARSLNMRMEKLEVVE